MAELTHHPVRVQLLMGPGVAVPAPRILVDALTEVTVQAGDGSTRSGFELVFRIPTGSTIATTFPVDVPVFRVIVAVTVNGVQEVLVDGMVNHLELTNEGTTSTLNVKGTDLLSVMDQIPFDGLPFPAMSPAMRVALVLAKYAALGCVPVVIPSLMEDVPIPVQRIPQQQGTDYAYVNALATKAGHVFYQDPGPLPGMSKLYWGPSIRIGLPQPALTFGLGRAYDNVKTLTFTVDRERKEIPIVYIQEPNSKAPIPLAIPDLTPLSPPLALVPPLPPKITKLKETANLSPLAAVMAGVAYAAQHSDAALASGTLDVRRYGRVLRSRQLVGVRGTGILHDGLWYVTSVTHQIKRGEFTQAFKLARNGVVTTVPRVPV
jgi:hypothetical protein